MDPNVSTSASQLPVKILIVEDDEFLRELYAETLSGEGYTVETAIDGEDGYNKMKQGGWDLVLLDIIMPKMNGLEVIKKIKAESPQSTSKSLVFLTNLDKDAEIKEALQYGDGYLIKSQITPGDMIREVKIYLDKKAQSIPTA
jgi:CheY-like chemotaxis protein